MKKPPKKPRELSASDWAVMKVLWEKGPMAAGEIHSELSQEQDWAYSTAKTLLRRLVEKGWITYRRVGSSFLYRAAIPKRSAVRRAVNEFSDRVLNGLLVPFVSHFVEERGLTPEDIRQLEEIIQEHRDKEKP